MGSRRTAALAWAISAGLHLAAVAGLWAISPRAKPPVSEDEFVISMPAFVERDRPIQLGMVVESEPGTAAVPAASEVEAAAGTAAVPGRPPVVVAVPAALPKTITEMIRERADRPAAEPVRDVVDVTQASATQSAEPTPNPSAPGNASTGGTPAGGSPVHAPLAAGKTVAYVLDCSGTMGLSGRMDRARAALLATLAGQPDGVRVVVVTYRGKAAPLLLGGAVPLSDAVRGRVASGLAALEASGESRHAEGVRVALKFDPDYLVLLTDADDAELSETRPVLAGARRPVSAAAVRVTATGLEPLRPVR